MKQPTATKHGRKPLGFTELLAVKLTPAMLAHVRTQAEANYMTAAEYMRRLIIADFLNTEPE